MNKPVTTFDALYAETLPEFPLAFLRRLAAEESNSNPNSNDGGAKGLLQITPVVAADYEQTHGKQPGVATRKAKNKDGKTVTVWVDYSGLFDPRVNVRYAAQTLRRVVATYGTHPFGEARDWRDWHYAGLVVFGWNAGYSARRGVGRCASELEKRGSVVTVETVRGMAELLGPDTVAPTVASKAKAAWSRMVARRYLGDVGAPVPPAPGHEKAPPTGAGGAAVAALLALKFLA